MAMFPMNRGQLTTFILIQIPIKFIFTDNPSQKVVIHLRTLSVSAPMDIAIKLPTRIIYLDIKNNSASPNILACICRLDTVPCKYVIENLPIKRLATVGM